KCFQHLRPYCLGNPWVSACDLPNSPKCLTRVDDTVTLNWLLQNSSCCILANKGYIDWEYHSPQGVWTLTAYVSVSNRSSEHQQERSVCPALGGEHIQDGIAYSALLGISDGFRNILNFIKKKEKAT